MRTHNSARYQCSSCGRPFDRKDALARHMQLHEPGRAAAKIRRKSCTSCFRSKVKCSGTRPICSSCEKRGVDCRYPKDGELRQRSAHSNRVSHAHGDAPVHQANGDGQYRSDSLFPETFMRPSSFTVAETTGETSMTSLSDGRTSKLRTLGRSTVSGNSPFDREHYSYSNNMHEFDSGINADWLGNGILGDSVFAESFIPGLFDFFPTTPAQLPHPVASLARNCDIHKDVPENDTRDQPSNPLSDFEHPWPMEWNPGSAQPLSLPPLEESEHYKSVATRVFSNSPITASGISTLRDRIKSYYDYGPWQQIQLEHFPSADALNHAIDMYFVHFHAVLPMIHHPTFDPEKDLVVTLSLVTIGVKYTGFPGAQAFSKALFELTRRLIISRTERERRFVRTEAYLTAQMLQAVFGYLGDDERTFEMAEAGRSSIVYNAKCMGLFRKGLVLPEAEQTNVSPEELWHAWIRTERYRRLAWSIYELDTSAAYLHNNKPLLSPSEVIIPLPCSSQHWEAPSARAWASLHPWTSSCPPTTVLRDMTEAAVCETEPGSPEIEDEKHRFLVVLGLARTLWSLGDVHFASIIERHNDGFESTLCSQQQEQLLTIIDKLHHSYGLRSKPCTRSQQLQVVYRTQLTHIAHILGAGDLMTFLYPYLRRGHELNDANIRMYKWAERDTRRVRRVAYHCAQLLALMRKYPSNLPSEPFVVFHAGTVLSMTSIFLPPCPPTNESTPLQIDHLDDDDQQAEKAQAWIQHGGNYSVWVHGVTSFGSEQGREQVLDQTAWLLGAMNVWPIAKKFAAMTFSLREGLAKQ